MLTDYIKVEKAIQLKCPLTYSGSPVPIPAAFTGQLLPLLELGLGFCPLLKKSFGGGGSLLLHLLLVVSKAGISSSGNHYASAAVLFTEKRSLPPKNTNDMSSAVAPK